MGTAELGIYFLAAKLAFLPNEIASEVVGAVSFPVYARVQSNISQATRTFRAIFTSMFLVLTPVFTLMFFWLHLLLRTFWEASGKERNY
jgi:hypothetical protein